MIDRAFLKSTTFGIILVSCLMVGSLAYAYVVWDPLRLNASINIVSPQDQPVHQTRWAANITLFNFTDIEPGYKSDYIYVHLTNTGPNAANLTVGPESLRSGLHLLIENLQGNEYVPILVNAGGGVSIRVAIQADADAATGPALFKVKFGDTNGAFS